jgi:LysR family transcriptional regulator for metE and metH
MSLNISLLQLIQTLVEEHTLTRTAQRLHLTQSALSHQLRNLEESLGIEIFHRLGKRMQLTQAGERLLRTAQTVLTELQSVEEDIRKLTEGRTGAIRFSTECYTCYHWLPPLIERYRRHFPQIDVQIVAEATQRPGQALLDGRLDLAIMHNPEQNDRMQYHPLFQDELVAIVPPDHPFAERKTLQPADFADQHIILYSTENNSFLHTFLYPAGVHPKRLSEVPLTEAIIGLVKSGLGVSVLAQWAVAPDVATGTIAAIPLTDQGFHRQWIAGTLKNVATPPYLQAFIDLIANQSAGNPEQGIP